MVFSSPPSGFICSLTGQTPDLLHPLWPEALWCVVLFLSSSDSSLFVTPSSSDPLLSPIAPLWFPVNPLIRHNTESSYSFYSYLPLCLLLGYGLCTRPALNIYVYNVWCLLLAFPRLDINLDLSTTYPLYSNLRVVLVDNSFHPSLICCSYQVFKALKRKLAQ